MSEKPMVKYVKFVPDNLQEELNFMGVMFESGIIERDNFVKMQGMLEIAGHIPCENPDSYDTGNDFLFRVYGYNTITKFIRLMKEKMPNSAYKISDEPFGRLKDKEVEKNEEEEVDKNGENS